MLPNPIIAYVDTTTDRNMETFGLCTPVTVPDGADSEIHENYNKKTHLHEVDYAIVVHYLGDLEEVITSMENDAEEDQCTPSKQCITYSQALQLLHKASSYFYTAKHTEKLSTSAYFDAKTFFFTSFLTIIHHLGTMQKGREGTASTVQIDKTFSFMEL